MYILRETKHSTGLTHCWIAKPVTGKKTQAQAWMTCWPVINMFSYVLVLKAPVNSDVCMVHNVTWTTARSLAWLIRMTHCLLSHQRCSVFTLIGSRFFPEKKGKEMCMAAYVFRGSIAQFNLGASNLYCGSLQSNILWNTSSRFFSAELTTSQRR